MPDPLAAANVYAARMTQVRRQVVAYIAKAWGTLDNWRDADIDRFVELIAPTVLAGQQMTARLVDGQLAAYFTAAGIPSRPIGIDPKTVTTEALRGVSTREAFERAGAEVRRAIAKDVPIPEAAGRGLTRATSVAETNLQLAKTHTAQTVMEKSKVVGYRRTLTGSKSCVLCSIASTQRYHRRNLMPIHPGCDCGVAPIIGEHDPGRVIDEKHLREAHEATGDSTDNPRLIVHEHGEIGPVLAVKGQHFTGPDDI